MTVFCILVESTADVTGVDDGRVAVDGKLVTAVVIIGTAEELVVDVIVAAVVSIVVVTGVVVVVMLVVVVGVVVLVVSVRSATVKHSTMLHAL